MLKGKVDRHDLIIWILVVTIFWYVIVCGLLEWIAGPESFIPSVIGFFNSLSDPMNFVVGLYLLTLPSFLFIYVYTAITKRNRFIFRSFLPGYGNNKFSMLLKGLLVGFIMNFGCIVCALACGNIKLFLNFYIDEIPFYLFALFCVLIQSASEELWCRGFMYERINVRYPLRVAILVNGVFFAALHLLNPGVGALPIIDIAICGLAFSVAKWYTGSIWFPIGIHTAWNFTQNLLFGLPNSGLVSEVSIFGLDAANARSSLMYDVNFGVEGAIPAVAADAILGIVCLILAARKGRLGELKQKNGQAYR
ncbi:MAG: type II CAAX endopeptidase family protein [Bacillota bacterium]|nr:type II CAAX endopeptidase family protein [Bacillota bacterium]